MRLFAIALMAAAAALMAGCAATSRHAGPGMDTPPSHVKGEVAVFGKVRLVEFISRTPMPSPEQDGSVYLTRTDGGETYKAKCLESGEFGAYLPAGRYAVTKVKIAGFTFGPDDLTLTVPEGHDAAYVGTTVFDGTPSGPLPGGRTRFVMTVKDEYPEFAAGLRKAGVSEARMVKSLLQPGSAFASGDYPNKVFRAKDVEDGLMARTGAVEEVVKGGIIALTYVLNPVWIFTLP